jgi:hypothetical protein
MSFNKKIKAFNLNLIRNEIYHDINTYYKIIIRNFYKEINTDFIEYLFSLIENDEIFIINSNRLLEFGIFDNLENIFLYLEINNLKLNIDYMLREVQDESNKITHEYILTPDSFKLCAMSSPKTKIYREYYLIYEKIFYFNNLFKLKISDENIIKNNDIMNEIQNLKGIINNLLLPTSQNSEKKKSN